MAYKPRLKLPSARNSRKHGSGCVVKLLNNAPIVLQANARTTPRQCFPPGWQLCRAESRLIPGPRLQSFCCQCCPDADSDFWRFAGTASPMPHQTSSEFKCAETRATFSLANARRRGSVQVSPSQTYGPRAMRIGPRTCHYCVTDDT